MKIYLVKGETGEHGDAHTWIAKAFYKEEDAKKFSENPELNIKCSSNKETRRNMEEKAISIDPLFCCDYTGTTYTYFEIYVE